MDFQTLLVVVIAACAAAYLARAAYQTWSASGCAKGCGCGPKGEPAPKLIAPEDLFTRVRSGVRAGDKG